MQATKNFTVFGDAEANTLEQMDNCLKHEAAIAGALMADNHLGYSMPIGGVVVYQDHISPTGVGFDIACGNKAVLTSITLTDLLKSEGGIKPLIRQIQKKIEFGMGRKNATPIDHELFDDPTWDEIGLLDPKLKEKARQQLGTVGSGNHYVDLLVDEDDYIWIACHFGSRGLGHTLASGFMSLAMGEEFTKRVPESEDPVVLSTDNEIGELYISCMELAGDYAYAGRDFVIDQVLDILGVDANYTVHNHHNFAWKENDNWVVRKGATPLTTNPAFIGGSMGDISVIVRGIRTTGITTGLPQVKDIGALGSAPHGAGRVMSRTKAAGKMRKMWVCSNRDCDWQERAAPGVERKIIGGAALDKCPNCGNDKFRKVRTRDKSSAMVDWDLERRKLAERNIVVLGAGADESPAVYKNLSKVLAAHSNIEIIHTLYPVGVVMAGEDIRDDYKD